MGWPVPDSGSVTEDVGVVGGLLTTSGDIDYALFDDTNQWTAETIAGAYGSALTIDANGAWVYTADNDHPAIEALNDGDTLTEVFNVTSANGASTITITINGTTDPPCFVAGTLIDTPSGPRPVQDLRAGDVVLTRDNGPQVLRWVGGASVALHDTKSRDLFQPVRIAANALGPGLPRTDLLLSPQHRLLISRPDLHLLFGESEVFCSALHLVNDFTITRERLDIVTYFHLLFDAHQVVTSQGCASESFFPGQIAFDRLDAKQREELFALFPDLKTLPTSYGPTARMSLKSFEARLLRDRYLPNTDEEARAAEERERLGCATWSSLWSD